MVTRIQLLLSLAWVMQLTRHRGRRDDGGSRPDRDFVDRHPTIKMLALSFLVLVGFTLIAEGFETHVPKGYINFATALSIGVEMLNLRIRARRQAKVAGRAQRALPLR